jgi:hypothetical protein
MRNNKLFITIWHSIYLLLVTSIMIWIVIESSGVCKK